MKLLLAALLCVTGLYGATDGAGHPNSNTMIFNSGSKLGPNYGETNGTAFSNLAGVSDFSIYNSTGSSIAVAFPLGISNCSSGGASTYNTSEFVIPPSTGFEPQKVVAINKYACVRSKTGASISQGTVELTIW